MTKGLCHETAIDGQYPIRLFQTGIDSFNVTYGSEAKSELTYKQAATEYGLCLMHALACQGKLTIALEE